MKLEVKSLIFALMLFSFMLVQGVSAQTYVPGVAPGDWFTYSVNVDVYAPGSPLVNSEFLFLSQIEWINMTVKEVVDARIVWSWIYHFYNGSEIRFDNSESFDVRKGEFAGSALKWYFIGTDLEATDKMYPAATQNTPTNFLGSFNGSGSWFYQGFDRETNVIDEVFRMDTYGYALWVFDKKTGLMIEWYESHRDVNTEELLVESDILLENSSPLKLPDVTPSPSPSATPSPSPTPTVSPSASPSPTPAQPDSFLSPEAVYIIAIIGILAVSAGILLLYRKRSKNKE